MQSRTTKLALVVLGSVAAAIAQTQSPSPHAEFEVASVKPTASADGRALLQAFQGRLTMTNLALRRLILIAYGVQDYQLSGDPPWIDSDHYDIQAKTDGNTSVQEMEGPMLQALLEDRFKMKIHRETRQLPVYELKVAKGGAKLQPAKEGSCTPYLVELPPPASAPGASRPTYCGARIAVEGLNRTLDGKGVSMEVLATNLSRTYNSVLGRNVIDETGLTGTFDIRLKWAIEPLSSGPPAPGSAPAAEPTAPSVFTALQEQLGLKLEAAKGPVEVLVIDHIEKPTEN